MKKFIALLSALILSAVVFVGCSATAADPFTRAGFLADPSIKTVHPVSETNVYTVTYEKNEKSSIGVEYAIDADASFLKTELSVAKGDGDKGEAGKDYYLFKVELNVSGMYTIDGASAPATNVVSSEVYFCGLENSLKPVFSHRSADVVTLEDRSGKYGLTHYKYETTTRYGEKTATVTVTPDPQGDETYAVQGEYTMEKVFATNYIDNELLLFAPRAMDLDLSQSAQTGFYTTFNSLDVLSKKLNAMRLSFSKDETIVFADGASTRGYKNTEFYEPRTSVNVKTLTLSIASKYAGASQTLSFATAKETNEQQRLIAATYPATLNIGTFRFLIKSSVISL